MIIGKGEPLYEAELGSNNRDDMAYLHQFIIHSSLDMVENAMWQNSATYVEYLSVIMHDVCRFLRIVDRFNNLVVSAYVTPGGVYLLLLHEGRSEDAVRGFMTEVHEIYVKHMLNPFAQFDAPIASPQFDSHVRHISRKFLSL